MTYDIAALDRWMRDLYRPRPPVTRRPSWIEWWPTGEQLAAIAERGAEAWEAGSR